MFINILLILVVFFAVITVILEEEKEWQLFINHPIRVSSLIVLTGITWCVCAYLIGNICTPYSQIMIILGSIFIVTSVVKK